MHDEHDAASTPRADATPAAPAGAIPTGAGPDYAMAMSPAEVEEGKVFAILSWALSLIGIPFFLIPLIIRNNAFSLFHAKQCLMLWLVAIAVGVAGFVLTMTVILACVAVPAVLVASLGLLVLDILGIVQAAQGQAKPLPAIGGLAESWFRGIRVVNS